MQCSDPGIEVVIRYRRVGDSYDVDVQSNARDIVRTMAVLRAAFRRLYQSVQTKHVAREALLLPGSHRRNYERVAP